ncbi:MAG: SDR family oxidoreductase [Oscillospiraceae bacterium]|nr:SDR family oxidoreductase [Oscillospiraceae bacterium]
MESNRFEGKVALVTGTTSGIGQATAVRLAAEGAIVAFNHLPELSSDETMQLIKDVGGQGFPIAADVGYPDQVMRMIELTAEKGGRLDYIVSNAGINPKLRWDETTLDIYDRLMDVNLKGTWVLCSEGAKQMIKEGHPGSIVTISSISAHVGAVDQTVYCATKAGVLMLTKALALVLGEHGIRINSILPGSIYTGMSRSHPGTAARKFAEQKSPLGRMGSSEEIASAVSFLLSEDASYITSAELLIDGGMVANAEFNPDEFEDI